MIKRVVKRKSLRESASLKDDADIRISDTNPLPKKGLHMVQQETTENALGVDKGLVAMFLKLSPEERLQANDNAARAVKELRDAYKQRRNDRPGSERLT